MMKRIISLFAALLMAFCLIVPASAEGSVTYYDNANRFIFAPGTKESPTSLFENFQNVMPGDTLTEQVDIINAKSNRVKLKVYMRSLGAQYGTDEFLSQMNLTVTQEGDSPLFAAPADETAQLTDWVYLGTVYSGGKITLNVTLEVPITMGNDFKNNVGYVDWQFKIEELPVHPSDPPATGDTSNILLYSCIMLISLGAVVAMLILLKRRKQEEAN